MLRCVVVVGLHGSEPRLVAYIDTLRDVAHERASFQQQMSAYLRRGRVATSSLNMQDYRQTNDLDKEAHGRPSHKHMPPPPSCNSDPRLLAYPSGSAAAEPADQPDSAQQPAPQRDPLLHAVEAALRKGRAVQHRRRV